MFSMCVYSDRAICALLPPPERKKRERVFNVNFKQTIEFLKLSELNVFAEVLNLHCDPDFEHNSPIFTRQSSL